MTRRTLSLAALITVAIAASADAFGGWAIITLRDVPGRLVVGTPTELSFIIRQHGVDPLTGLEPVVEARTGTLLTGTKVTAKAKPGLVRGQYTAALTVPKEGEWRVTINSGFGPSKLELLPIRATDGKTTVAALAGAELGKHLFVAKGCVMCHVHAATGDEQVIKGAAPDLTGKQFDPAYLALWLADPSIRPPSAGKGPMPNLALSKPEIAALALFVNDRSVASAKR